MINGKFFIRCSACNRFKIYISKAHQRILIPGINKYATLKEAWICKDCWKIAQAAITEGALTESEFIAEAERRLKSSNGQ